MFPTSLRHVLCDLGECFLREHQKEYLQRQKDDKGERIGLEYMGQTPSRGQLNAGEADLRRLVEAVFLNNGSGIKFGWELKGPNALQLLIPFECQETYALDYVISTREIGIDISFAGKYVLLSWNTARL